MKDTLTVALQEVAEGLPPGTLLQKPDPNEGAPGPTMPEPPDWRQQLAGLGGAAPTPGFSEDMLDVIQQQAASEQDRVLGNMFADSQRPKGADTSRLPKALDRYLDRILST